MDQKRLFIAIAASIAILLGFQLLVTPHLPRPPAPPHTQTAATDAPPVKLTPREGSPGAGTSSSGAPAEAPASARKEVPRLRIAAPRVQGSMSLVGARLDDLVLSDYKETLQPNSPLVRLLEPRSEAKPYYVQYGWSAPPGASVKLPDNDTQWTASDPELTAAHPVTLSWNNGEGLTFELALSVDDNYMFSVEQRVRNAGAAPVQLVPWARIRRDYTPEVAGYYILFEGLLGVADGTLQETKYSEAKSEGEKHDGVAFHATGNGGWGGITDKYWLTALVPDQAHPATLTFRYTADNGAHYQVDYAPPDAQALAPGGA